MKASGVTGYRAVIPSGSGSGTIPNRTIPATVKTFEGTDTELEINGIKHDLYMFDAVTAGLIDFTILGSSIKIYEIMVMDFILRVDSNMRYPEIIRNRTSRKNVKWESASGSRTRSLPSIFDRRKWAIEYDCYFDTLQEERQFLDFQDTYANFGFAHEYERYPEMVYPALFEDLDIGLPYVSDVKTSGIIGSYIIEEK